MNPSENELIEEALAGDAQAFAMLAQRFARRVYTLALYYTRERADAEDLTQEVWLKAYSALGQFRGESSFYTWLRQITVNTFLNHRRGERLRRGEGRSFFELEAVEGGEGFDNPLRQRTQRVEEDYHRRLLVEKVFCALGELTPQQRLIFLLKHREGLTYEEISKLLDCSTGTIKKSLFRAVTKLRHQLGVAASCAA